MAQPLSQTEAWFSAHKYGRKTQMYRAVVLHKNWRSKFLCDSGFEQNPHQTKQNKPPKNQTKEKKEKKKKKKPTTLNKV